MWCSTPPRIARAARSRWPSDGCVKITFLCPHLRIAGGVRAILTYADRLAAGHDVTVVVEAKGRARALWRSLTHAGPTWVKDFRARVVWVDRWRASALPQGDAIVATAWQSAAAVAAASAGCGRKFYLVQHYESLYHGAPAAVDETYRLPLCKITISTWLRDVMRERFDSDAEILVTPVDRELFHPVPAPAAPVAPAMRAPGPRVLMLHHEYVWKGVADGLAAVARVKERVPGLRLVGFGLKAPRTPLGYDEFHANPQQDKLAALYSGCEIYLCPSWDEGLGMPPMEAMACGAALCTYDNGGCRDYAIDGATALVAPRRDVEALARALARLAEDGDLRERIARQGRELVVSQFDWKRATVRLEALLQSPK